jgi:peptide/nickel transport system substrate-binding protein
MMQKMLILSALVGLTSVMGASAQALPTNDELKIGITQEFETLNPLVMTMAASNYMSYLVNRQFVYLTPDGKWQTQLVKTIPSIENKLAKFTKNPDGTKGLSSTWEILDNAKWGDGEPVTCNDVKFTWQSGLNQNISIGNREAYENIQSVTWDEKNPKKCEIVFKKAKWDFSRNLFTLLSSHIESKIIEKFGDKKEGYDQNSEYNKNPTNPGLYNGPYVISELKLGSHVTFVPNPHFYGKQPSVKKVIFKLIPNTSTLEANLRSGTIDMVSTLGFAFDQALAFEKKINADKLPFKLLFKEGITYEHIDFDMENPILKDVKVRQAIVTGINRDEITKALFEGKQRPAIHNLSPLDPNFTDDPKVIKLYPYSKRDAAKLLDEAGWKMGPDGYRAKDGKRLSFPFMTTAGNKTRETVQTMIQSQLKALGVEVVIKNEPARVFFGETTHKRKFGGMAMYAWVSAPEQTPRSTYHSSMIPTEKNGWSGQNQMAWRNAKVDSLVDKLEEEFSAAKRKQYVHELLHEYTSDVPVIPLYYRADISAIPMNMTGFKMAAHLYYETNEIENWALDTKMK